MCRFIHNPPICCGCFGPEISLDPLPNHLCPSPLLFLFLSQELIQSALSSCPVLIAVFMFKHFLSSVGKADTYQRCHCNYVGIGLSVPHFSFSQRDLPTELSFNWGARIGITQELSAIDLGVQLSSLTSIFIQSLSKMRMFALQMRVT